MRVPGFQWNRHKCRNGYRLQICRTARQALRKSAFCLIDPPPQQVRVEPVRQRDCCDRYSGSVAGSYYRGLELLAVASPASTFGGRAFFDDSVHVSAYSLSGHDTPKSFTEPQDGLPGRLPKKSITHTSVNGPVRIRRFDQSVRIGCPVKLRPKDYDPGFDHYAYRGSRL